MKKNQLNTFRIRTNHRHEYDKLEALTSLQFSITCKSFTPQRRLKPLSPYKLYPKKVKTQKENVQHQLITTSQPMVRQTSINCQPRQSLLSVITSESNVSAEEEYEIWDNSQDLRLKKLIIEDSRQSSVGQFLQLYKARFGGFPGQQQTIRNEEVIKATIGLTAENRQLFKKYFPKKQIVFEDDNDYSQPYNIESDQHFQSFNDFCKNVKHHTINKISSQRY